MISLIASHFSANFFAFLLPILLFLYWGIIGYAVLAGLYSQRNHLQNLLLAPAIGLSLHVVSIFLLNWFGIPVVNFSLILAVSLLIFSIFVLAVKKPLFPGRRYLPFALCLLISMFFMGSALLRYGFNWLSFGNDDMVNYALGAIRFMNYGYNVTPTLNDFINGRDYSVYYWFMHVAGMQRAGSELLIAWLASITKLSTLQVFMPLIVGLNLTLISAGGAVIYRSKYWRPIAIAVSLLLAFSGLQALGVFYQLIAQVFGISLLLTTIALVFKRYDFNSYKKVFPYALLISLVLAAVTISYPEVSPFLIISYLIFLGYRFYTGLTFNRYEVSFIFLSCALTMLIVNTYFINYIVFLLQQVMGSGLTKAVSSIFPYILVPTGFANIWNILPISSHINEPWLSLGIFVGDVITLFVVCAALLQIKRLVPTALFSLVMIGMGIMWYFNNQGFVLFKLSMYIQPFLISTFVIACYTLFSKKQVWKIPVWTLPVLLLALVGWNTQAYYLERSYGTPGNFVEFPNASKQRLVNQFIKQMATTPDSTNMVFTSSNMVEEKLDLLLAYNHPSYLLSRHVFDVMMRAFWVPVHLKKIVRPALWDQAEALCSAVENHYETIKFNLFDNKKTQFDEILVRKNNPVLNTDIFVFDLPAISIFNHWRLSDQKHKGLEFLSKQQAVNLLTFVHSKYSQNYYLGEDEFITLYGSQKDYYYPGQFFVGIGKRLMFELINPTPKARILLTYSATLNPERATKLPQVDIVGEGRKAFPVAGYGSARISVPMQPQWIKGIPYALIDIKEEGKSYKIPRYGLMKLYGENVTLDYRRLSAYIRDVSVISEDEYQQREAPTAIEKFPEDLANKNLEYSGIYEEGWVGDNFYVNLKQPKNHNLLVIKGLYPLMTNLSRATQIRVSLDGKPLLNKVVNPGEFKFNIVLPDKPGIKHLAMSFSDLFTLPGGDRREVSAKINSIEFQALVGPEAA